MVLQVAVVRVGQARVSAVQPAPAAAPAPQALPADLAAWAVIGLGTVSNIARELGALSDADRRRLIQTVGRQLLEGDSR